jgi:hypothetical protein
MKRDWKRARAISAALIALKDALAKQDAPEINAIECRAILDTASPDALAAEGELELAWLYYNQQRGIQLVAAPFRSHMPQEEGLRLLSMLYGTRKLPKVPSGLQSIDRLKLGIELAISDDLRSDAQKWKAIAVEDEQASRKTIGVGDVEARNKKEQERELKILSNTKINCISGMIRNHVEYWAQKPYVEHHIPDLGEVFWILSSDPGMAVQELRRSWHDYEDHRKRVIGLSTPYCYPHYFFTQNERDAALSRTWPAWCRGAVPETQDTRDALEAHIRKSITEDIAADRTGWDRLRRKEEERKQLYLDQRPARIAEHRKEFTSKIIDTFGQEVLDLISEDDIAAYSEGMADYSASRDHLWNTVIDKYEFDQKTTLCLYFIRQGARVKIGITSNLEKRLAQIRTSAPQPCKVENVVYTHYGELLERKLHRALTAYNTHLEWFDLPPKIAKLLFEAKSKKDFERFIEQLAQVESE